jgi:hypothetical protein
LFASAEDTHGITETIKIAWEVLDPVEKTVPNPEPLHILTLSLSLYFHFVKDSIKDTSAHRVHTPTPVSSTQAPIIMI